MLSRCILEIMKYNYRYVKLYLQIGMHIKTDRRIEYDVLNNEYHIII